MSSPSLPQLDDFPDWLSPLVVKDLRRGLRQRTFSLSFLALLIVMSLVFISLIIAEADSEALQGFWMWTPISFLLLLVQPARGLNALVEERKIGTLPLMQVTGMSSFRIVFGKWASLCVQSLLFAMALLPYLVLGHFLGGIEFFAQLLGLCALVLQSFLFTAVAVSLSAIKSTIARVIVTILLFIFGFQFASLPAFFVGYLALSSGWVVQAMMLICGFFASVFLIFFILSLGATRLAIPGSENYSTVRRLLALIFVLILSGILFWSGLSGTASLDHTQIIGMVTLGSVFWAMIALDCLTDPYLINEKILQQMKRWPSALRWLLTPGWPFGWLLTVLSFLLITAGLALQIPWWQASANPFMVETLQRGLLTCLSAFALVSLPAWMALRIEQSRGSLVGMYFTAGLIMLLVSGLVAGLGVGTTWYQILALTPLSNLYLINSDYYSNQSWWALASSIGFFLLSCGLFFWRALQPLSKFPSQLRQSSKQAPSA